MNIMDTFKTQPVPHKQRSTQSRLDIPCQSPTIHSDPLLASSRGAQPSDRSSSVEDGQHGEHVLVWSSGVLEHLWPLYAGKSRLVELSTAIIPLCCPVVWSMTGASQAILEEERRCLSPDIPWKKRAASSPALWSPSSSISALKETTFWELMTPQ